MVSGKEVGKRDWLQGSTENQWTHVWRQVVVNELYVQKSSIPMSEQDRWYSAITPLSNIW